MRFFVLLAIYTSISCAHALHDEELFLTGNNQYQAHEYQQAYASYKAMDNKGHYALYNMGNAAFASGEYDRALLCWQAALKRASRADCAALETNMQKACRLLEKNYVRPWPMYLRMYTTFIPTIVWQVIAMGLLLCMIYMLLHGVQAHVLLCLIIIGCAGSSFIFLTRYYDSTKKEALVLEEELALYAGPGTAYHVVGSVRTNTAVAVFVMHDGWCQIHYQGLIGWVSRDRLVLLE